MKAILLAAILIVSGLPQAIQSPMKKEQEHGKKETKPANKSPNAVTESASPVATPISQPAPNPQANDAKEKPSSWPAWTDIFWPTWVLVIVTAFAVAAALKTLGSINAQVEEMKSTGVQTDKLIAESMAQTKSLVEQSQSLAKSAYYLGESSNATYRSASAMEKVADKIAVSAEAATASVSAINQQMRAYISVVIGSATYQERTKNLKFQAIPSVINAGLTPAHKVSFKAGAAILPNPLPDDFDFPLADSISGMQVIGPRQNITVAPIVGEFVDDAEVDAIKSGAQGKALFAWGIFNYEDIFGTPQYTKFCHIYTWFADGKTVWGYYASRHNEAS